MTHADDCARRRFCWCGEVPLRLANYIRHDEAGEYPGWVRLVDVEGPYEAGSLNFARFDLVICSACGDRVKSQAKAGADHLLRRHAGVAGVTFSEDQTSVRQHLYERRVVPAGAAA